MVISEFSFSCKLGLPYNEEIVVKDSNGIVRKVNIGSIEKSWEALNVLSINKEGRKFGSPKFVPIKDFSRNVTSILMKFHLSDGRQLICSPYQILPKMAISIRVRSYNSQENTFCIKHVKAQELQTGDNLLILHKIPFSSNVPKYIFIPKLLDWEQKWIGIKRREYLKFSYRTSQRTDNILIKLINSKFKYSKVAKMYRVIWANLSNSEKDLIEIEAKKGHVEILVKIHENVGHWYPSLILLTNDFFRYLGWYVAEGAIEINKNRITITQSKEKHYNNWQEIIDLLNRLNFPLSYDEKKSIRINSNVISELTIKLCSKLAQNKQVSLQLFNIARANSFLESYYKGDGDPLPNGLRRFSTVSRQLKNDLVAILGATGHFCSIHYPTQSDNCYRIIETVGRKYKRKFMSLLKFNSTSPVKIKSIEKSNNKCEIFNLITDNSLFASTNGIIVHHSLNC